MPEGVGRALERMVKKKELAERMERRDVSLLMNSVRRDIFEYLCLHPCSTLSEISEVAGISPNTSRWHLSRLLNGDLISVKRSGGRTLYYPSDFVPLDSIQIFGLLSNKKMRELYTQIVDSPGSTTTDLSRSLGLSPQAMIRALKRMENLGLVSRIQDGIYVRYFPTDILAKKKEENTSRMKRFQDSILKRLASEGLRPKIVRRESVLMIVEFSLGSKKGILRISTDPFTTALS